MRTRRAPCDECPWRRDVAEGAFPVIPAALSEQAADGSGHARLTAPIVACHKTTPGKDLPCSGWLAVEGHNHLGVRLGVIEGRIDPARLSPGADWPPLVADLAEMVARHPAVTHRARHAAEATPRG